VGGGVERNGILPPMSDFSSDGRHDEYLLSGIKKAVRCKACLTGEIGLGRRIETSKKTIGLIWRGVSGTLSAHSLSIDRRRQVAHESLDTWNGKGKGLFKFPPEDASRLRQGGGVLTSKQKKKQLVVGASGNLELDGLVIRRVKKTKSQDCLLATGMEGGA